MKLKEQLTEKLSRSGAMPFLFVGSGISRRYLKADNWAELLARFAANLPNPFEYYRSRADKNLAQAASLMVPDFHTLWFHEPAYQHSREEALAKGWVEQTDAPLKIEVARYIAQVSSRECVPELLDELQLLGNVQVDGVITTNWDTFLEDRVFQEYRTFIGQDSLLFSAQQSVAEIYKIHGCCRDPLSLVLTKSDYEEFERKNPYLAAKLLTTFVDHPIVFLGYSLSDSNVFKIFQAIASCMSAERLHQLSDRLIFVQYDHDGPGDTMERDSFSKGLPLTVIKTKSYGWIYEALAAKQRTYDIVTLRQMKERIYELVRTNDPLVDRYVRGFDELEDKANAERFMKIDGIGPEGLPEIVRRYTVDHIIRDILFGGKMPQDPEFVLTQVLPELLVGNTKLVPIFKYLSQSKRLRDGTLNLDGLADNVKARAKMDQAQYWPVAVKPDKVATVRSLGGIKGVIERYGDARALPLIPLLDHTQVNQEELRNLVMDRFKNSVRPGGKVVSSTDLRRLVCFYDWVCFAPHAA